MTHGFKDLLDFFDEAWSRDVSTSPSRVDVDVVIVLGQLTDVEDGHSQFDVPKVTRTFLHALFAGRTTVSAVDGAQLGVIQALFSRPLALLIHSLRILDVADTHVLDLFRREEAELNLLHRLQRR